jgi:molecular chaperone DnaK
MIKPHIKNKSIIGIDFGTTKTIAAIFRDNLFEIIPDSRGRLTIPSLVLITPEEEIFVGWEAKLHPQRYTSEHITINSIKRVLGKEHDCVWGNWKTHPQEIAALILARLKIEVEIYLGEEITDAVIAIPAHFDINQRWAVLQAAEIAGFKVRRLINEATAAATFYTRGFSEQGNAIIVDIGGGTTDVSIISYGEGLVEVQSTTGDHYVGGDDFDQIIVDHLKEVLRKRSGDFDNLTNIQEFVLRSAATNAKIELTDSSSTRIYLPAFIRRDGRTYDDLDYTLSRDQFIKLLDPFLKRILSLVDEAQRNSELTFKQIDKLILVGGSSMIPKIREMISKHIGLQIHGNIDHELSVAKGAAALAGILQGDIKGMLLLDTLPCSLSIEDSDGSAQIMIPKNKTIPTISRKIFSTTQDNQQEIEIRFFEGESKQAKNNIFIGKLMLSDIPNAKKGTPKIEVTLDIDANGTICARAKETASQKETRVRLLAPFLLNQAQINVMRSAVSEVIKRQCKK